uniref:Uncharacterized protein n=1 Tax=Arundo donax TaxID=35708 RepID=A0A0A9C7F7_ARUDO
MQAHVYHGTHMVGTYTAALLLFSHNQRVPRPPATCSTKGHTPS